MKYRYLGRSGLLVSRVCLGTMTFGMKDWGCDEATSKAILDRFIDAGGNFIDTADLYSFGVSEEILGRVIKDHGRDDLVIATKCWFRMRPTPNAKGLSRKNICAAVDASLKRMDTDYIDLYQVHGPDPYTPVEETMRALDDLVRSGKVRYIGCSNYYAWQIVKANAVADQLHLERFISGQHMYSLCKRDVEREILPACADQGLGLMCWAPLASGFLTGKYQRGEDPGEGTRISYRTNIDIPRYFKDENFSLLDELRAVAAETGMTLSQVALAWLVHDRRVTAVIIGVRTMDQLEDNLVIGDSDLSDADHRRLSDIVPFDHGYPLEWIDLGGSNIAGQEEFTPDHYAANA